MVATAAKANFQQYLPWNKFTQQNGGTHTQPHIRRQVQCKEQLTRRKKYIKTKFC